MNLYFIRHGQTDWNVMGRIQGSYDSDLNDTGRKQAENLGDYVLESKIAFSKIYSSKQKRAVQTAQILSKATSVDCIPIDGLEEVRFGEWEGLTWEEVRTKYPKEYEEWFHNRRYAKTPQGESYQELIERVVSTLKKIISQSKEDVAIVTHGAVIMCLQCYLTDTPFHEMFKFKAENATITKVDSSMIIRD